MSDSAFGTPGEVGRPPSPPADGKRLPGALRGLHVLVVDDNRDTREMLRQLLTHAGALVTIAADAEAALAVLRTVAADVVISDLAMPHHDGRWLIKNLRALGGVFPNLPAIAITAYRESQIESDALAAGFDAYLEKPLDFHRLIDTILRVTTDA